MTRKSEDLKWKIILDAFDGEKIPVTFFPCDNPKGLFQIIHGSLEHKQRYYDFCEFLNKMDMR